MDTEAIITRKIICHNLNEEDKLSKRIPRISVFINFVLFWVQGLEKTCCIIFLKMRISFSFKKNVIFTN